LCNWGTEFLPDNLTGHLLVLDEAHHAGSSDEAKRIVTRLGEVADTWRERGGKVLYVTATPYRSDGERVLPEGTTPWTWTIADHAASGFAPANFHLRTVSSGVEVSSPAEYAGDALPTQEEDGGDGYRMMVDRWIEDGRPKSVFIVPARDSVGWATRLERALVDAGARVCNAVGTDAAADERFSTALDAERTAGSFAESSTDVFIACKRFDEGTDWPLCSHVYNWGVPASFGLIIQRWGRTFRDKSRYPDYPEAVKQVAQLTFFIPRVAEDARDQFSNHHHEHAWLLGTYLADWETGREYRAAMRLRFEQARSRRPEVAESTEQDDVNALFGDLLDNRSDDDLDRVRLNQAATLPDHVRAEATALIGQVEIAIGGEPMVRDIVNHIEALGVDPEMMAAVRKVIAERVAGIDAGAGNLVDSGLDRIVSSKNPLKEAVRRELADLYRSVIDQFGDRTVPIAGAAMAYATQFTGDDAKVVADRLRRALDKPDFTVDGLEQACRAFHAEHGTHPGKSGDCSRYFGWADGTDTWQNVDSSIRNGARGLDSLKGSSLARVCKDLGIATVKSDFTVAEVEMACRAFYDEHGTYPKVKGGDCYRYFGWADGTETWVNVDNSIRNGLRGLESLEGSSLARFCQDLGIADVKPDFTVEELEQACRAFHAEHGTYPKVKDGDCSRYFGRPDGTDTWLGVDKCIRKGSRGLESLKGSSLARFCQDLGIATEKSDFTVDGLEQACRAFHAEHGTHPKQDSGDCSRYFGRPDGTETWKNVNQSIRNGARGLESLKGSSLVRFCQGLDIAPVKSDFTVEELESACRAFHAEHGTYPKQYSGDCSRYFGWPDGTDTWQNVDACIRNGARGLDSLKGSSLARVCKEWGLVR
jgi:hypothetical protein